MSRRPDHALRVTIGVAVLAALWLVGLHVGGLDTGLLFLTPAFVLLLPLLAGRYVGERALARLRRRRAAPSSMPFVFPARPRCSCRAAGSSSAAPSPDARHPWRDGAAPPGAPVSATRAVRIQTIFRKGAVPHDPQPHGRRRDDHRRPRPSGRRAGPRHAAAVLGARRRLHEARRPRPHRARRRRRPSKVDVRFPAGFAAARYQAVPGWKVKVVMKKLATPIQTDDGPITEGVDRMTFTRTSKSGGIKARASSRTSRSPSRSRARPATS